MSSSNAKEDRGSSPGHLGRRVVGRVFFDYQPVCRSCGTVPWEWVRGIEDVWPSGGVLGVSQTDVKDDDGSAPIATAEVTASGDVVEYAQVVCRSCGLSTWKRRVARRRGGWKLIGIVLCVGFWAPLLWWVLAKGLQFGSAVSVLVVLLCGVFAGAMLWRGSKPHASSWEHEGPCHRCGGEEPIQASLASYQSWLCPSCGERALTYRENIGAPLDAQRASGKLPENLTTQDPSTGSLGEMDWVESNSDFPLAFAFAAVLTVAAAILAVAGILFRMCFG